MKKKTWKMKSFFGKCAVVGSSVLASAGTALAAPTITVPSIAQDTAINSGQAVFTVLAAVLGIIIALRVFKKI